MYVINVFVYSYNLPGQYETTLSKANEEHHYWTGNVDENGNGKFFMSGIIKVGDEVSTNMKVDLKCKGFLATYTSGMSSLLLMLLLALDVIS